MSILEQLKKGQKCWGCKKIIKRDFCWNGLHYWHEECLEQEAIKRYSELLSRQNISGKNLKKTYKTIRNKGNITNLK